LPSQSESFGLSSLEAMACGVPVVASNIGGIPEVVEHGESGFVAELGDTKRMAKYVVDLLINEKKNKVFAQKAQLRAKELFEAKAIVKQYEDLYIELLNK
jgi:L-malate glycosyltransferase